MDSHDSRKLPDEELMHVSGGDGEPPAPNKPLPRCPDCGTKDYVTLLSDWNSEDGAHLYMDLLCEKCHNDWTVRYY